MRRILIVLLLSGLCLNVAAAQTAPRSIGAHYRAYADALAEGNLTLAEQEAEAAFQASLARDGDGGNTAALALNLATVRLSLNQREAAYEPALRAHQSALAGGTLDPMMTALVLGRAELTPERAGGGRDRLEDAIAAARPRADLDPGTYLAAADLGAWLLAEGQFRDAAAVFEIAIEKADAAGPSNTYAQAQSRIGHGTALAMEAMTATIRQQARPTDTRLAFDADGAFREADASLEEAQVLLAPAAFEGAAEAPTLGQSMYASTLAWRTLLRAFAASRGMRSMAVLTQPRAQSAAGAAPFCALDLVEDTPVRFPPGAISTFSAGAAVVQFHLDPSGAVAARHVVAAVPDRWFREAVEEAAPGWRVERHADAPADCQIPPIVFVPFQFYFQ